MGIVTFKRVRVLQPGEKFRLHSLHGRLYQFVGATETVAGTWRVEAIDVATDHAFWFYVNEALVEFWPEHGDLPDAHHDEWISS